MSDKPDWVRELLIPGFRGGVLSHPNAVDGGVSVDGEAVTLKVVMRDGQSATRVLSAEDVKSGAYKEKFSPLCDELRERLSAAGRFTR